MKEPDESDTYVANVLVNYRKEHNLNQTQLSEKLGIAQQQVSRIEKGTSSMKLDTLYYICKKLGFKPVLVRKKV